MFSSILDLLLTCNFLVESSSSKTNQPFVRPIQRRILPPSQRFPVRRIIPKKTHPEIEEIIRKLKSIGK